MFCSFSTFTRTLAMCLIIMSVHRQCRLKIKEDEHIDQMWSVFFFFAVHSSLFTLVCGHIVSGQYVYLSASLSVYVSDEI